MAHLSTTSVLPFAPRPYPDEIMSSWLSRVSCRYDLTPGTLLDRLDPRDVWSGTRKIDWKMPEHYKICLAAAARLDEHDVAQLDAASTHPRWAEHWFAWEDGFGRSPWVEGDLHGYTLRWSWCVPCLVEGYALTGQDFIRLPWALACVGYCHEHKIPLTDKCACGAWGEPTHVADGNETRLICTGCERPISSYLPLDDLVPTQSRAVDLQLAFERYLVAALNGKRIAQTWCGRASNAQILAVVDDVAHALCIRPSYDAEVLIETFDNDLERRLPRFPNLDHILCALPSFWRACTIGAVLAIIGRDDICDAMSGDLRLSRSPAQRWFPKGRRSLKWMVDRLHPADVQRLINRSQKWPPKVRKRLGACVH